MRKPFCSCTHTHIHTYTHAHTLTHTHTHTAAAAAAAALAQQEESAAHKKAAEAKQLEGVADALEQHVQQQRTKQQIQREEGFDDSGQLDFTPPSLTSALRAGARALLLRNVPLCIMYLPSHAFFTM